MRKTPNIGQYLKKKKKNGILSLEASVKDRSDKRFFVLQTLTLNLGLGS